MITLEEMKQKGSECKAIEWALSLVPDSPKMQVRPSLCRNHTKEELEKYNNDFSEWVKGVELYNNEMDLYFKKRNKIHSIVVEYIKDMSGLNDIVPEQYRDKVYSYAWSEGHSSGYYEAYIKLCNLVEIFE